jgi:antitoxin component HigA of HigAB toxin-antitoxin module
MDAKEIKKFLIDKDLTVTDVADSIGEHRSVVSRVLNYKRATPHIRKKIERLKFGRSRIRFDERKAA